MFDCGARPLQTMKSDVVASSCDNGVSSSSKKISPLDVSTNTTHRHTSMSHGVHQRLFSSVSTLERSKSLLGTAWMFMEERSSMDHNLGILLNSNEHIRIPESQFEAQNVGENSAFLLGDGEIMLRFNMIAMLHSAAGNCLTLKESSYELPLHMIKESVQMRVCCDAVGTHKPWYGRAFLCFPLRVQSQLRDENTALIARARHAVITWPEIPFRLNNTAIGFKFERPRTSNVLCYRVIMPNFLCIFMQEHDICAS